MRSDRSGPPPEDDAVPGGDGEPQEPPQESAYSQEAPPPDGEEVSLDRLWEDETYEELIVPEEEPPPKPKKQPRRGRGLKVLSAVLVILLFWTLLSPQVLGPVGTEYVSSPHYAEWGNYTGTRDLWAGSTTWGVSIRGISSAPGNASMDLGVLVTKLSESAGNWFFRGTGISLRNVSAYDENGTFLGAMTNRTDLGYGVLGYLPITFPGSGVYWVYVAVKFSVSEVMRVGFFPLETVRAEKVWIDFPIRVS